MCTWWGKGSMGTSLSPPYLTSCWKEQWRCPCKVHGGQSPCRLLGETLCRLSPMHCWLQLVGHEAQVGMMWPPTQGC